MKTFTAILLAALSAVSTAQSIPRPEHPRPDLQRANWLNLNGSWEFGETDDDSDVSWLTKRAYPDKIIVPFCRESKLSGLGHKGFVRNVWYRKTFRVPVEWKANHVILHIGASDWKTTLWVNGMKVGEHTGGQTPIDVDVSAALQPRTNTVVIHVFDDTRSGLQALGKQCPALDSYGCLYTRTTGIWQTVWLEGLPFAHFTGFVIHADPQTGKISARAALADVAFNPNFKLEVFDKGRLVATSSLEHGDQSGQLLEATVPKPKLWSAGSPHIYDLKFTMSFGPNVVDTVSSYTAFRSVSTDGRSILINGKRVFQRLVLDQGFYPDGVWTAPTDDALKHDIEMSMAVGFNGARLHQKVFEPRYLYWADKLGYLVWGEYPNWGLKYTDSRVFGPVADEWRQIIARDQSHPSIIGWCPFNETPPEAIPLQNRVVDVIKGLDSSRPIIDSSGYAHDPSVTRVLDAHDYDQDPASFKIRWDGYFGSNALPVQYGSTLAGDVPFMVSEYGGIGWDTTGGWGYGDGPKTLEAFYARFKGLSDALLDNRNMFGFCYTQITDVEQECNGIYKYDRTPKFDVKKLHAILSRPAAFERVGPTAIAKPVSWNVLVGSARDENSGAWKSTTSKPADNWKTTDYADASWYVSPGGFGQKGGWEKETRTPWATSDIWLRRTFDARSKDFKSAMLAIHYDNAAEVYVNGRLVWKSAQGAWNDDYQGIDVTKAFLAAVRKGQNLIAVHCHQDTGGQFIDLALLVR